MRFVRHFSRSQALFKDSKKDALRSLGDSLLKGQVKNEWKESPSEIQLVYDSVSHMTSEDVQIQHNLDQGGQFQTFESDHYLDRKRLLREIPDEIDIFTASDEVIKKTYHSLEMLDKDKSVQFKYYKRYIKRYDDPVTHLIQQFNGIDSKFKMLRRREIDNLSLSPGSFYYRENLLKNPYNVVGFDRSISGLPLRSGKNQLEQSYPQEFIEDLQMYRKIIPVQKRDLDFIEPEEAPHNVDPSRLARPNISEMDNILDDINHELTTTRNTFSIRSIGDYQPIPIKTSLQVKIELEILDMKLQLQQEIETAMTAKGSRLLMFNQDDIRTNFYKFCEAKTFKPASGSNIVIVNYNIRELSILPPFYFTMNSRKQQRGVHKHLMKLFIINLEDQIDTLMRIKYQSDAEITKFMKKLANNIRKVISTKLMDVFEKKSLDVDAVVYKPLMDKPFKRILWSNNEVRKMVNTKQKSNYKLILGTLET